MLKNQKLVLISSIVIVALVAVIAIGVVLAQSEEFTGPTWEYRFIAVTQFDGVNVSGVFIDGSPNDFTGTMAQLFKRQGRNGWEYIDRQEGQYIFKRETSE